MIEEIKLAAKILGRRGGQTTLKRIGHKGYRELAKHRLAIFKAKKKEIEKERRRIRRKQEII